MDVPLCMHTTHFLTLSAALSTKCLRFNCLGYLICLGDIKIGIHTHTHSHSLTYCITPNTPLIPQSRYPRAYEIQNTHTHTHTKSLFSFLSFILTGFSHISAFRIPLFSFIYKERESSTSIKPPKKKDPS